MFSVPVSMCPACGYVADTTSSTVDDPRPPRPGSLSVCFACGTILKFNNEMKLDLVPKEDMIDLILTAPNVAFHLYKIQDQIRKDKPMTEERKSGKA